MLENRLDKAMIKYNEAQSIRKTYEQIVKRLKARACVLIDWDVYLGTEVRIVSTLLKWNLYFSICADENCVPHLTP